MAWIIVGGFNNIIITHNHIHKYKTDKLTSFVTTLHDIGEAAV